MESVTVGHAGRSVTIDMDRLASLAEGDVFASALVDVEHGSRFSRAWLAASTAASTDDDRPALFRTTCVEVFDDGYRLTSTDSYWTASAWVGDPVDPDQPWGQLADSPAIGELPARVVPVVDHELRIRDLMRFVARRTKEVDASHPDIPLTFRVVRDRSEDIPTLDPLFDRDRVDVSIPAVEQVAGFVNEIEFVNVARFHSEFAPEYAAELDRVQVSPRLLRSLAQACTAVGADGCLFSFDGDPKKPIGWEVVQPAAAVLFGLVMPQRQQGDDE